jgi:deoxyribonuclease-4
MRFGFHISIAGGFKKVVERARERQCETIQLFSRNPRGWKHRSLDKADIAIFKKELACHDIGPVFVHLPYLVNLASAQKTLFRKSLNALCADLERCAMIGAPFLIMHVGSAGDSTAGLERISIGINKALTKVKNNVKILLENTAGSGNELGYTFEQLKTLIDCVEQSMRIGVVLDTAHAFAAGYDLRAKNAVAKTFSEFERIVGLDRLFLVHLNDSKAGCGSRVDRHWHIAEGKIGFGMYHILHHRPLQNLPFIMETPRTNLKEDIKNMKKVRSLLVQRKD